MPLEPDAIRRAARLARITLSSSELDRLANELGSLVARLEPLRTVQAPAVEPERDATSPRADVPGPDPLHGAPARFAPAWRDGYFTVPRVIPTPE